MKSIKYILLIIAGVFLSELFNFIIVFAFGIRSNLPLLMKHANVFFATIIIGAVVERKGWIFGLVISLIELILLLLFGWFIIFSNASSYTFLDHLAEQFKQSAYWVSLVLISGILGGLLGSLLRTLILKWRNRNVP